MAQLLSTQDVARQLGVSTTRVRALITSGKLKASRIGKFYVVRPADLSRITPGKPGRPRKST